MNSKQCSRCGIDKPLTAYYRHSQQRSGYRPECKECQKAPAKKKTAVDRFWQKVKKGRGCWEWTGSRATNNGYGRHPIGSGHVIAHRFSWELHFGEIPKGKEVCHSCDNPGCVRPEHLYLGTHADNMQDMVKRGRGTNRITEQDVREIKRLLGKGTFTQEQIADTFNISRGAVGHIKRGTTWRWLNE